MKTEKSIELVGKVKAYCTDELKLSDVETRRVLSRTYHSLRTEIGVKQRKKE